MSVRIGLLWIGFFLCGQPVSAQRVLQLDPAVRTGRLNNGFTYYIRRNTEPKDRVWLYLVNKAGSILESEDQRGLAHFMEHMSFNGTRHFPKNELIDYLQKAGVRFGADINAHTSFDETVYELPLPTDKPEVLKTGLQIVRDWANEATLDPVEIDKERGVVLEEKRLGKGAAERMRRVYYPIILNGSRYAERLPIGLDTVLNHFQRPAIRRFYHDWYRPDLQALIVVGDIDVDKMEQEIRAKFRDLRNPAGERARPNYTVPLTGKDHYVAVTDKEMTGTEIEVLIKHKEPALRTDADYRRLLVRELFNSMLTERYGELGRQADAPFIKISAGITGFIGGLDMYDAEMVARPDQIEQGFKALWRETERMRKFGFTRTELERAKKACLSRMEVALKEKGKTPSVSYVKEYEEYFLKAVAAPGIDTEYALAKRFLPEITLSEVNDEVGEYIKDTNRDILFLAPDKEKPELPDEATVLGWMKAVAAEGLKPYKDEVSVQPLLRQEPEGGVIVREVEDKDLGVTVLTLGNGAKVVLKPTTFKNDEILFNAYAPGGSSLASDANYQSAASAVSVVGAGGLGNFDITQLQKYLNGKQMNVQPKIEDRYQEIGGACVPGDLETALQLVYGYFTEPRKDTAQFRGLIERSKDQLINRTNNPNAVFSDTVNAVLGSYNVRRTGPVVAKLDQVNLDTAYGFYRDRFSDASAFTFTFVGSFDVKGIKPLLAKYLGSLPATHKGEVARDLGIHIPRGQITKVVHKGSEPRATVYLVFPGDLDYNQQNLINLDALKETLQIRMLERLREDESGVYSPRVAVSESKYPQGQYAMVISFGCAPENADKLVASALDEVARLRNGGPLQQNVDKWRAEDQAQWKISRQENKWWLHYLVECRQNNEDLHGYEEHTELVDKVTAGSLKQAADLYLSGKDYIRLELLPEK